jgi:beta-glucosidase
MNNKWMRVRFQPNLPLGPNGKRVTACAEHIALSKQAAMEGMVLLKNENNLLPLVEGSRVALFGKASFDYVKGGGGSGDVTVSYIHNLYDGLQEKPYHVSLYEELSDFYQDYVQTQYKNGGVAGMLVEPAIPDTLLTQAAAFTDTACITISRFSGEGWDRKSSKPDDTPNTYANEDDLAAISARLFERSDFYLTSAEEAMVTAVCSRFSKVFVVLNVGGMVDTSWFYKNPKIQSVLLAWQGGMEGGSAAAAIIRGESNPCGKLPDTFAASLEAYPSTASFHESDDYVDYTDDIYVGYRYFETIPGAGEKVCYPFGFGLSYTKFELKEISASISNHTLQVQVQVTNTGSMSGKEVVQLYYSAPDKQLGNPSRVLGAFVKTRLLAPGEGQLVSLSMPVLTMASFDDLGRICQAAYVLEAGTYTFYIGTSVRDTTVLSCNYVVDSDTIVCQLSEKMVPTQLKCRLRSDGTYEPLPLGTPNDPDACGLVKLNDPTEEIMLPQTRARARYFIGTPYKKDSKTLFDVANGITDLDTFIAQLSNEELAHLLGGQPNTGVANTFGFGNLPEYGIPNIMTADGPAGLRIQPECGVCTTAWPCATLLAATWNPDLVAAVGRAGAMEVKENNIALWLTPAINIHRSPLCGRNFEYYSEDPLLAGKMAAAMVSGIQSQNIGATVKHFACNNKETNRTNSDSRVSQRALREIYLKAFEIVVKEASPWAIMSSYNIINGHRASENKEMLTDILREEWGFTGLVTTDWWTKGEHYKEINAGNDIKMGCGFPERVLTALEKELITRKELVTSVKRLLELILKLD